MGSGGSKKKQNSKGQPPIEPLPSKSNPVPGGSRKPSEQPASSDPSADEKKIDDRPTSPRPETPGRTSPDMLIPGVETDYEDEIAKGLDDRPVGSAISKKSKRSALTSGATKQDHKTQSPAKSGDSGMDNDEHIHSPFSEAMGRCQYCPHCQQARNMKSEASRPPWFIRNPDGTPVPVDLDDTATRENENIYVDQCDVDAINEDLIKRHGRIPGAYDFAPHLTIDDFNDKHDDYQLKNGCDKQTYVVRKSSPLLPACTPFPDREIIERRDRRLNKPFEPDLYE